MSSPVPSSRMQYEILRVLSSGSALSPGRIAQRIKKKCPGSYALNTLNKLFDMWENGMPLDFRPSGKGTRWWRTDV
jgi:hypothetical protein